jgi:hypothetical protein
MTRDEISFFTADSMPYGKTYGSWTVKWWNWALGLPKSVNPVLDPTGEYANTGQNEKDVFFLAGNVADEHTNIPNRICRISKEKSILFPVINCESNRLEHPELITRQDIIDRVRRDEDTIVKKECLVDGERIPVQRVKSDPLVFNLNIVEDNLFHVKGGTTTTDASSDGYWVFLKPLSKGRHIISFEGSCEFGRLHSGAIYRIEVI